MVFTIKEDRVLVTLISVTIKHYESLGYEIPRRKTPKGMQVRHGATLLVDVTDLPVSSRAKLTKICDYCSEEVLRQSFYAIIRCRVEGKDRCRKCSLKEMLKNTASTRGASISRGRIENAPTPSHNLLIKYPEVAKSWHPNKNKKTPIDYTPYSSQKAWWLCAKCGYEWEAIIGSRTNGGNGCFICSMSKGERRIVNFLRQQNIVFILQATAPGLVGMGGNPLRFDFVLPTEEGRWSCVIEFDGILHSGPRDLGDGAEISLRSFKVRQEHDRRKDEWCAHNGIPLLRINHTEFNHIEDILTEEVTAN